jgi:hypothetical protein
VDLEVVLPAESPVPIMVGGTSAAALRRMAEFATTFRG